MYELTSIKVLQWTSSVDPAAICWTYMIIGLLRLELRKYTVSYLKSCFIEKYVIMIFCWYFNLSGFKVCGHLDEIAIHLSSVLKNDIPSSLLTFLNTMPPHCPKVNHRFGDLQGFWTAFPYEKHIKCCFSSIKSWFIFI